MNIRRSILIIVAVFLSTLLGLFAIDAIRATLQRPPSYPGAYDITVKETSQHSGPYPSSERRTTFKTADTPSQVLAFYKAEFTRREWVDQSFDTSTIFADSDPLTPGPHPVTWVEITVASRERITTVEVRESHGTIYVDSFEDLNP